MLLEAVGWSLCAGTVFVATRDPLSLLWDKIQLKFRPRPARRLLGLAMSVGAASVVALAVGISVHSGAVTPAPGAPNTPNASVSVTDTSTWIVTLGTCVPSGSDTCDSIQVQVDRNGGNFSAPLTDAKSGLQTADTLSDNTDWKADTTYVVRARVKAVTGGWSAYDSVTVINSAWPNNEPAGMTLITSTNGSDKYFGTGGSGTGWFFGGRWNDNTYIQGNVTASGSRYGTAVVKRQFIGDPAGWNGLAEYTWSGPLGTFRHLYIRWIVKYSSNYEVNSGNDKHFYVYQSSSGGAYVQIRASTNDHFLVNEMPSAGFNDINLGADQTYNSWDTYELYYIAESSASASDGSYTLWRNNVQLVTASGQNWSSETPGFGRISFYEYYGGNGPAKTVNDSIMISELYISGKN